MSAMKVVVTGGAGFIGANLCRVLLKEGVDEVAVVDDLSTGLLSNLDGVDVRLHEASILDPAALDAAFDGADSVVHLGAVSSVPRSMADPARSHHANATGTLEVLEAVRRAGGPHLVVASSSSVYGANPRMPKSEGLRPQPISPYAATKLATEAYSLAWADAYGLDVLAFRFFNVFGPLQRADHVYAAAVPAFVSAALGGRPLPVFGDGEQTRDFTFVEDVALIITDAVLRRVSYPDPVNLAFGGRSSLLEVIAMLEEILGRPLERSHQPPRPGDMRDSQADQTRLRSLFPSIEPVSLLDGLRRTVEWFQS